MSSSPERHFPELVHPLALPDGQTHEQLFTYLSQFRLDGPVSDELVYYLREDFVRFVLTLGLVPPADASARLLEIGANPYFMSILLRKYTHYGASFVNYFGRSDGGGAQTQRNPITGEAFTFEYLHCNIDSDELPFGFSFDTVLFCEVLEHLILDPVKALLRIKAALKPGGCLILTTPNVARLENVARLVAGASIYDPYSGYGPYGRHNREYNRHELVQLLEHCGFEVEVAFSADVHPNRANDYVPVDELVAALRSVNNRGFDLGQYLFIRARNAKDARNGKPRWLYRSLPDSELA
jgi:SAM-dependent methyltransferase